jgi:hypothetical protein
MVAGVSQSDAACRIPGAENHLFVILCRSFSCPAMAYTIDLQNSARRHLKSAESLHAAAEVR